MNTQPGVDAGEPADLDAWLRLVYCPGIGTARVLRLLRAFGSAPAVLRAPPQQLQTMLGAERAGALLAPPTPQLRELLERAADWLQVPGQSLVTLADRAYPEPLLHIADPPPLLWARGDPSLLRRQRLLGVVGTRHPSAQGARDARNMGRALAAAGVTVVSGMARGVDAEAHRGALLAAAAGGSTIAVLGTGCDRVYPAAHHQLATDIAAHGLLLSELALGQAPRPEHFPRRNRIISGLSRGVLVTEAALHSGSLITARLAADQGREVFAMPGSIHNPVARGCHGLLRDGACLVEGVDDVLRELGWEAREAREAGDSGSAAPAAPPPEPPHDLLDAMGFDPIGFDQLLARCGGDAGWLRGQLLELELQARVTRLPGGRVQRLHPH